MLLTIVKVLMSALFIWAGSSHFRNPKFFLKITPPWVPKPAQVNLIIGVLEILMGLALWVPKLTSFAAWAMIALLIAVFPANVYHFQKALKKGKHVKATAIRLPFQFLFLYLAYLLT